LLLGHRPFTAADQLSAQRKGWDGGSAPLNNNLVYFNSADFNGHQFLTDDAMKAGYTSRTIKPDASIVEKGIASLVEQDISSLIVSAEDALLRILVKQSPVRTTVKNMLEARSAVSYGGEIQWSCPAKEWLFGHLVGNSNQLPEETKQPSKLRFFLAQLPDVPPLAFSAEDTNSEEQDATTLRKVPENDGLLSNSAVQSVDYLESDVHAPDGDMTVPTNSILASNDNVTQSYPRLLARGSLEGFFADESASNDTASDDAIVGARGDLAVQEILVTLLWASSAMTSKLIRQELVASLAEQKATQMTLPDRKESSSASKSTKAADEESDSLEFEDPTNYAAEIHSQNRDLDPLNLPELSISSNEAILSTSEGDDEKFAIIPQLDPYQKELLSKLLDTTRTLQSLKESAKRITARLMDESSSIGIEGHMSAALQADLASRLDDHVRDVCQIKVSPEEGSFFKARNDEPYEEALERMAEEWGEWFDDEYVWSPGDSLKSVNGVSALSLPDPHGADEEIESLPEFFERIDREWEGWDDS
jgi:hypothetical protein